MRPVERSRRFEELVGWWGVGVPALVSVKR
jgi:hypothetical protein